MVFLGDSLERVRNLPSHARSEAGHQLSEVQNGNEPDDWGPLETIGDGVCEIRIRDDAAAFRVIYLATLPDAVLVLHIFEQKTEAIPQREIDVAISRLLG